MPGRMGAAADKRLTLAVAASLEDSGFLDHILPIFRQSTGIVVTVRAQPSGAALRLAREGKVDAVLLDDYDQEAKAVEDGSCVDRRDIMYSDLVLIGPRVDPAGVEGMASIIDAAKLIAILAVAVRRARRRQQCRGDRAQHVG